MENDIGLCLEVVFSWRAVSAFRGVSWASEDRGFVGCRFGQTYLILMNITSTQWKQTPFF